MSILERIYGHEELSALRPEEQQILCDEIRAFLIDRVSKTGGHLASNLGVVELTVAIETVFNTNIDRLVFDVGHQSYVHKLLTGRQADFDRLRQFGGIAGFPKPSESVTDAFVAGHASSSVSIALGMARARTLQKENYHVVALLGDGAATGGMIYEGLNDASESKEPMVIILNDNEMSIDRNVGGMAKHLSRLRTKERYLGAKRRYRHFMDKLPGGSSIYRVSSHLKDRLKSFILPGTLFDNMGLKYLGPVDGHDLPELIRVLRVAKSIGEPVVVHVLTKKGNGFKFAEDEPSKFHGVGSFDPDSGKVSAKSATDFSGAFGRTMVDLAEKHTNLCAITAAMPAGTGLLKFKERYPDRLFDVGIAEEHAVSMAGGLAKQGMVPVVALYSTFLQRAYDQLLQDIAMQKLHVVFAVDRAGLVGDDGETHHGTFDTGFLRQIPGMTVLCPASELELSQMLRWAVEDHDGPVAIRYPRGGDRGYCDSAFESGADLSRIGALACHRQGSDVAILTYGAYANEVFAAADKLRGKGISASVIRLLTIQPLPIAQINNALGACRRLMIAEEAISGCGVADALISGLVRVMPDCRFEVVDLGCGFVTHGSVKELYRHCAVDSESIAHRIEEVLRCED